LAEKPLAVAITEVLFAEGGLVYSTEKKYEHLLVNLYLPFVNLNLPGLSEKALSVFAGRNCQGIDLHGATLREAHFERADFEKANLKEANLEWANLEKADLREAHLESTDLQKTKLKGADLKGAELGWADWEEADLFGAQLTERDFHQLPTIGVIEARGISEAQKADLIVLALFELSIFSTRAYQLTATRKTKTVTHEIGEEIEHIISGYQLNEQKTKELNQANWDIEIKELPSDNT